MGNYLSLAQWEDRMDVAAGEISDQLIPNEAMITRAEGLVNGFLAKRYNIPIVTDQSNGLLQELTAAVADYELYKRGMATDVPEKYKYSYEKALDILMKITNGELSPFTDTDDDKMTSIDIETDTALFDYESMKGHF